MNPIAMMMPDPHAPLIAHLEWMVEANGEKIIVGKEVLKIAKRRLGKKWCKEYLLENKFLPINQQV